MTVAGKLRDRLLAFSNDSDPAELYPRVDDEESSFAVDNRFALTQGCCLDRGRKSSRLSDLNHAPGHVDQARSVEMQLRESPITRRDWSRAARIPSFRNPIDGNRQFKKSDLDASLRMIRGTRQK